MANFSFHPGALDDYHETFNYYFSNSERAAVRFEEAVERGLEKIAEAPDSWPLCDDKNHFYILKKFPLKIVYHMEDETLVVVGDRTRQTASELLEKKDLILHHVIIARIHKQSGTLHDTLHFPSSSLVGRLNLRSRGSRCPRRRGRLRQNSRRGILMEAC